MVKWIEEITVTEAESDNFYHFHDNRVLPSHVTEVLAKKEGAPLRDATFIPVLRTLAMHVNLVQHAVPYSVSYLGWMAFPNDKAAHRSFDAVLCTATYQLIDCLLWHASIMLQEPVANSCSRLLN